MAIEAPISKFKRNNLKIYMVVLVVLAVWLGYDGYFSQKFIDKHTDVDEQTNEQVADATLTFHRYFSPVAVAAALGFGIYFFLLKDKKIIAGENELDIEGKKKVSYESIQKVDKTFFESKGFFIITYKDKSGSENNLKISDKRYDNLSAVLDKLIEQIA